MAVAVALVKAVGVLTVTGQFTANDTVIVGGITYKFVASPSSANDVDIGTDAETSLANLAAAINGTGTEGQEYAADTVQVAGMIATSNATTLTLTARFGGTWGNSVEFREGVDGGATFSITTAMASGAGDISGASGFIQSLLDLNFINSEVQAELKKLTEAAD